jgi:hypothetical protein
MRVFNLLILVLLTCLAVGCSPGDTPVQEASGFIPGFADGFLILFKFLGGYLTDAAYLNTLQAGTLYHAGYLSGATTFMAAGTLLSLP